MFNAVATYICHAGFTLVGNNTRTCGGDGNSITGEFDGEAATCEGECTCIDYNDYSY